MQFSLMDNQGYFFSSYDQNSVTVSQNKEGMDPIVQSFSTNIIITHNTITECNYKSLADFDMFDQIKDQKIDLVIFGINDYSKLYHHQTLIKLNQLKIGYELMNIPATCRSFNYLSAENRNPLAVILFSYNHDA
jgi:uncharacterized protein